MVQSLSPVQLLQRHGLEPARLLCGISQAGILQWVAISLLQAKDAAAKYPTGHSPSPTPKNDLVQKVSDSQAGFFGEGN